MNKEQEEYIISHWDKMSCESLRKQFNKKYGTQYKTTAFHYHTKRIGLSKHIEHKYTAEQETFLRENSDKMTRKELAERFNEKYGAQIKEHAIEMHCYLRGWNPQSDGKFKNGSVPWEKTKGGRAEYVKTIKGGNSCSFRKGHVPFNVAEVGAVRDWGHNIVIKTDNGWKNRLRHLWETERGEIPEGYVAIAVNGDKRTDDVEKLRLIQNKTLTVLMANDWCGKGEQIVDTGIVWSELRDALIKE